MTQLPSKRDDRIKDEVAIVGDSVAFHFLIEREAAPASEPKACCGNVKTIHNTENVDKKHVTEALDDGKRPCKQCVKWLRKMYDVAAYPCEICERVNILIEADFHTTEVPHAQTGHKHTQVCADCRDLITR